MQNDIMTSIEGQAFSTGSVTCSMADDRRIETIALLLAHATQGDRYYAAHRARMGTLAKLCSGRIEDSQAAARANLLVHWARRIAAGWTPAQIRNETRP